MKYPIILPADRKRNPLAWTKNGEPRHSRRNAGALTDERLELLRYLPAHPLLWIEIDDVVHGEQRTQEDQQRYPPNPFEPAFGTSCSIGHDLHFNDLYRPGGPEVTAFRGSFFFPIGIIIG